MRVKLDSATILSDRQIDTIDFSVSKPEIIFKLLTESLYKHPLNSMIREYISNARDAHREKGNIQTPIKVGIIKENEQFVFFIRDFGPGLSPRRLKQNFTSLGSSTKSRTSKFIGGFGIGSKVGFAYAPVFTVINRYKGKETVYTAVKDSLPKLMKVTDHDIDKNDTGLEIRIPLKEDDIYTAARLIFENTSYWHLNPFIDECVEYVFDEDLSNYVEDLVSEYKERIHFIDKDTVVTPYDTHVLVDYIPYSVDTKEKPVLRYSFYAYSVIVNLSVNDVTLTASRESIQTLHKTIDIDKLKDKFYEWLLKQPRELIHQIKAHEFLVKEVLLRTKLTIRKAKHPSYWGGIAALNDKYFKHKYDRFFKEMFTEFSDIIIPKSQAHLVPKQILIEIPDDVAEDAFNELYRSKKSHKHDTLKPEYIKIGDINVPKYLWKNVAFDIRSCLPSPHKDELSFITLTKREFKKLYGIDDPESYFKQLYQQLVYYQDKQQAESLIQDADSVLNYWFDASVTSIIKDENIDSKTRLYIFDKYIAPQIYKHFSSYYYRFRSLTEEERKEYVDRFIEKVRSMIK